jgi:hypothetical protein
MIILETGRTLNGVTSANTSIAASIFGMELSNTGTETYKVLYQNHIPNSNTTLYTTPAGTTTFIRTITLVNNNTASQTVQLFTGGTNSNNAITPPTTLAPSYQSIYEDGAGWQTYDTSGNILTGFGPYIKLRNFGIDGSQAETLDRNYCIETNTAALSTGRLTLQAIWLTAGMQINSISFYSSTTALSGGTNQLFGLYDINRQLLATTTNDTSTAWGANSIKTLTLTTAPYVVQYTGLYYLGIMVVATTVPTLKGTTALTATQLHGQSPILCGTSSTGLTTALPNPAAAITVTTAQIWGSVN